MQTKKSKWYSALVLLLDILSIALWVYFFVDSFDRDTSVWEILSLVFLEAISIFNLYNDRKLFLNFRCKE